MSSPHTTKTHFLLALQMAAVLALLVSVALPNAHAEAVSSVDEDAQTLLLADMGLKPTAALGCSKQLHGSGAGATCSCSATGANATCQCNGQTGPKKVCACSDGIGTIYCYYTNPNSTAKCRCDSTRPHWAIFSSRPDLDPAAEVRPDIFGR